MIKAVVLGAGGNMGKNLIKAISKSDQVQLSGAVEKPDSNYIGMDSGVISGMGKNDIPIKANLEEVIPFTNVTIDFTIPEATMENLELNIKYKKPAIIGTTGLSDQQISEIQKAAKKIPVLFSPNMSMGVNLLFKLVELTAKSLGKNFDVEIVEAHHRFKKDSPSGTAKKLGEIIADTLGIKNKIYGRKGMVGERSRDEFSILSVRGGDIVGEHTVLFAGIGERLELTHRAHSRMTFAQGAVKAAVFINKQKNGFFSMLDVLNLKL
ncbi:MAG: 4-hydroxy-tetrahydrodipicolinate reductase [Spirochaetes bacterium]|nr:4-hydroxy-tetrahydrodipicolinate reductase [Spirochaetota bacterium]